MLMGMFMAVLDEESVPGNYRVGADMRPGSAIE
jgi:hypothetical protein